MATIGDVKDITPWVQYTGGNGQTTYVYPFPIFDERDIVVDINDTILVLNSDYTVTGVTAEDGGTIILTTPTTGGELVTILRDTPVDRLTDYVENGDFLAETVNNDFDRLVLMIQEIKNGVYGNANSIRVPFNEPSNDAKTVLQTARANTLLGFNDKNELSYTAFSDLPNVPIATQEEVALTDGQTTVTFTSTDTQLAAFYLCGPDVDQGRLCAADYSITNTSTIELAQSYPAGSSITAVQYDQTGGAAQFVKDFPTLDAAVTDTNLTSGDSCNIQERTAGNGGGAMWDVVLASQHSRTHCW
jgi:hypothetical protein